jgi:signal transduction histidine kinase
VASLSETRPAAASGSLARFFALDDDWEREGRLDRWDVVVGLVTFVFAGIILETYRSSGALQDLDLPVWVQWLAVATGAALLVPRRRYPLLVAAVAAMHMFAVGVSMPAVMGQITMQVIYFCAIYSGVAWGRSRRDVLVVVGLVVTFMFAWIAWQFAVGSGIDEIRDGLEEDATRSFGVVPPVAAIVLLTGLVNLLYFGGAVVVGQLAWRGVRQRTRLAEQAALREEQGETLRRRAVLEERLRIARELHDVVAHHVSVIGINAGAARRVLGRDPAGAARALGQIEESSREAVTQMRGLLGTLRDPDTDAPYPTADAARSPEPGLADLPALVDDHDAPGLAVSYRLVEEPEGCAAHVPAPVQLSIYRTAQEALANVRRHSTASRAGVVVRVERSATGGWAEVEVTDDGRPRPGTSGSGLGQLGIRERVATLRGEVEIGPRVTGGYRVRVRLPLGTPRTAPVAPAGNGAAPGAVPDGATPGAAPGVAPGVAPIEAAR